jgi:aminoglycoside phosphotransferase (APT) family kinase protein
MQDTGSLLGVGRVAKVYRRGDTVLKLYDDAGSKASAFREAANLAAIEPLGLPAPRVLGVEMQGTRWGVAMTLAEGESFGEAMKRDPTLAGPLLAAAAELHRRIHACLAPPMARLVDRLERDIRSADAIDDIRRARLLRDLRRMPDGDRLCHGDFHPFNVIGSPENAVVVDWLDARRGPPAADLCRSWLLMHLYDPALARDYLAAYGLGTGAIGPWLPFIAAARLAEGVEGEVETLLGLVG